MEKMMIDRSTITSNAAGEIEEFVSTLKIA
jgi:hypothetical protein